MIRTALGSGIELRVPLTVASSTAPRPVDFEYDVASVLGRHGCNSGPCHGKARGQNGFALSLLGFDPDFDFHAIVSESKGRRVFPAAPRESLLLRKATAESPHGGGRRFAAADPAYDVLLRWMAAGFPRRPASAPQLTGIEVWPRERILSAHEEQQLVVTARFSDGTRDDVTHLASYLSNESAIASVTGDGLVRAGPLPGETAIMSRFLGHIAVTRILIPLAGRVESTAYARLPRQNFIDGFVWNKLERLRVLPSPPASDATFLRRAYLDVIGRPPTADEAREFLVDVRSEKRARLVDDLLSRPEYAEFWANKWADLLRPNPYRVGMKAVFTLDGWLRRAFREDWPYDRFVREIVAARGSTFRHGPATIFRDRRSPDELTTLVSQLFLGIRLRVREVPPAPVRALEPSRLLRLLGVLRRRPAQGNRALAADLGLRGDDLRERVHSRRSASRLGGDARSGVPSSAS